MAEEVVAALRANGESSTAVFVAGCAERMAQLFTGLWGDEAARSGDTDFFLELMENLWKLDIPRERFLDAARHLEEFVELRPAEEEIVDVAELYSFYAVLTTHYASAYRATHDAEQAIQCAHVALTAMGQLDNAIPDGHFMPDENGRQLLAVRSQQSDGRWQRIRAEDQALSLERLSSVRGRITR